MQRTPSAVRSSARAARDTVNLAGDKSAPPVPLPCVTYASNGTPAVALSRKDSRIASKVRTIMSWTPLAPRATLRTKILAFLILMASHSTPVYSTPAHVALAAVGPFGAVGPSDPATKFPFWYQDASGLRLGYCFDPVFCFLGAQLPDPTKPPSVPNNFPAEMFYWDADASMPTNSGGLAFMRLGVEAAFLPGPGVVDGDQVTFGRIRFRLDNLQAGATYTITHPYGVDTFVAQNGGVRGINATTDVGCVPKAAGVACDVTLALGSRIGPFLTWDTFGTAVDAPPAGFIGNFAVPHRVTGSPLGTNVFQVDGPDVGGPGVNSIHTDLFQLSGQIFGVAVTASPLAGLFNTAQAVSLTPRGAGVPYASCGAYAICCAMGSTAS